MISVSIERLQQHLDAIAKIGNLGPSLEDGFLRGRMQGDLGTEDTRRTRPYLQLEVKLRGDTLYRHATRRGLAHALIELRQDVIAEAGQQLEWGGRLARILSKVMHTPGLNEIRNYGSASAG